MWIVSGNELSMAEGDYGLQLPVTVSGTTLTGNDRLLFTFKTARNGDTILQKEYTPQENTVNLELSEAESELFDPGAYIYALDWYQSGSFMCNIIAAGILKVVDKA